MPKIPTCEFLYKAISCYFPKQTFLSKLASLITVFKHAPVQFSYVVRNASFCHFRMIIKNRWRTYSMALGLGYRGIGADNFIAFRVLYGAAIAYHQSL